MLTESQKSKLINQICGLVRESISENEFFENLYAEKKKHEHKSEETKKHKSEDSESDSELSAKKESILKWLDTAQELHSVLAYELWPDMDEDTARSMFSKKYRGHDNDGNPYHFDADEINDLYNMRDDFIDRAGLEK